MFQKEFVEKLLYPNEPKDINSQNMIFKYLFKANKIISVSPGSFFPIPKINSAVFKFEKKIGEQIEGKVEKDPVIDIKDFYNFIKACFNKRRKTLLNNLLNYYRGNNQIIAQILKEENIKINIRAEELKISDFTNIYKKIINLNLPLKP
jgi:16S rRNA (adenine1518-N6/adenine1519-N6)-dimethyltransferase